MKRSALIIALLLLGGCGGAQTSQVLEEKTAMQEIRKVHRRLLVSIKRKDINALNQIWEDEYLATTPTGQVFTKSDLIAAVKGEAVELEDIKFEDLKLRLFGKMAVVTGLAIVKGNVGEADFSGSYRGTGIFIKREDGWHPVGVHAGPADWTPNKKR